MGRDHGQRHALVVGLGVGDDEHVQAPDAGLLEPAQDRPAGRPGVEEHRRRASLQQRRVALADVQERDDELAGRASRAAARRPRRRHAESGEREDRARERGVEARPRAAGAGPPASGCADGPPSRAGRRRHLTAASTAAAIAAYAAASPTGPPSRTGTAASGAPAAAWATHSR